MKLSTEVGRPEDGRLEAILNEMRGSYGSSCGRGSVFDLTLPTDSGSGSGAQNDAGDFVISYVAIADVEFAV